MTRVKICGLHDEIGFDAAIAARADWVGFVFFDRSPRHITPSGAAALSARHTGGPPRVGLFVNPSDDDIDATLQAIRLDILQLYTPPARAAAIADRVGLPVWRAVHVAAPSDLPPDAAGAAAVLIEPRPPADAARPGGNATTLDWSMLQGWQPPYPWLLAGGLTPGNVAAAIAATGAPAVDVSSGVESAPGMKSPALIHAFVKAAHEISPRPLPAQPT